MLPKMKWIKMPEYDIVQVRTNVLHGCTAVIPENRHREMACAESLFDKLGARRRLSDQ